MQASHNCITHCTERLIMSEMGESTTKELDSATPEALGKRARTAEAAEPDVPPAQQKVQVKSNVGTAGLSLQDKRRCREMELQAKMQRSSDEVNQDTFNVLLAALGPNSTERVRGKAGPLEVKIIMGKSANGKVEVIIGVKNSYSSGAIVLRKWETPYAFPMGWSQAYQMHICKVHPQMHMKIDM